MTTPAVRPHRSWYKVKRNIYFYRPDAGASEHGRREIDFFSLLGKLDALDFSRAPNGRYAVQDNGDLLCAWVDQAENIGRMRFGLVRKNALPQSELGGKLKDLRLAEEEGICETAHLCFFPEGRSGWPITVGAASCTPARSWPRAMAAVLMSHRLEGF